MKKAFIGPLGDDLPSIVAIILSLTIFFTGLLYALDTYNQKIISLEVLRGSMDVNRVITEEGLIREDQLDNLKDRASNVARSYGIEFELYFEDDMIGTRTGLCDPNWYKFNYLVASWDGAGDILLRTLVICSGR